MRGSFSLSILPFFACGNRKDVARVVINLNSKTACGIVKEISMDRNDV